MLRGHDRECGGQSQAPAKGEAAARHTDTGRQSRVSAELTVIPLGVGDHPQCWHFEITKLVCVAVWALGH